MVDRHDAIRLDFERQLKRAEHLLQAARSGEPAAVARLKDGPVSLMAAKRRIARELRLDGWAALKRHIAAMSRERRAMSDRVIDGDLRTLHIRCGSDLRVPLQAAGIRGAFLEHSYPYLIGPVREGRNCLEQRAHFLVDAYGRDRDPPLNYETVLEELKQGERALSDSSDYERLVIWSEGDCYDQLVLIRLLAHFAVNRRPKRLELINQGDFPGTVRFVGLGQLPPEALRLLWTTRRPAGPAQLALGLKAWRALASAEPRRLAAVRRTNTRALPLLARALHRHLRELPSVETGLSLTEQMALMVLDAQPTSLNRLFHKINDVIDPLPGQGDVQVRDRVLAMQYAREPLLVRTSGVDRDGNARPPWTDVLSITELGRAVLRGEVDYRSLKPPSRWVGGVHIAAGTIDWRWDERRKDAVRR